MLQYKILDFDLSDREQNVPEMIPWSLIPHREAKTRRTIYAWVQNLKIVLLKRRIVLVISLMVYLKTIVEQIWLMLCLLNLR